MEIKNPQFAAANIVIGRLRGPLPLIGAQDGSNVIFHTSDKFLRTDSISIQVFRNGVGPLLEGPGNDFLAKESGGVGTGYDEVEFLFKPPYDWEVLTSVYVTDSNP